MSEHPRKRFGQNFLHDPNIIRRILRAVDVGAADHCVEIGPGRGALTRALAATAGRLDVIEIDRDLAAALQQQDWATGIHIHCGDALQFDFGTLSQGPRSIRLIGNLPYNISTPLLFHILAQHELFRDIHVMLQKEVVERMAALPGSKSYGRLSVALAARCTVAALFTIGPGAFKPAPKVHSAFARLTPLAAPLIDSTIEAAFDTVLRQAFGQRRKQLANALAGLLAPADWEVSGIDPTRRPETLTVAEFVVLARLLAGKADPIS